MQAIAPIMLSALEHYEYCARQCALILVDGLWGDNEHTVRGQHFHRRVDSGKNTTERGVKTLRSLRLWSERYGLTGRADVVEIRDGVYRPVEFKTGDRHGRAADVQVCAQALCLEEMFNVHVPEGAVWFSGRRRRKSVVLDDELRAHTIALIDTIRALFTAEVLPPAHNDERCTHCQLHAACIPERTSPSTWTAVSYIDGHIFGHTT